MSSIKTCNRTPWEPVRFTRTERVPGALRDAERWLALHDRQLAAGRLRRGRVAASPAAAVHRPPRRSQPAVLPKFLIRFWIIFPAPYSNWYKWREKRTVQAGHLIMKCGRRTKLQLRASHPESAS